MKQNDIILKIINERSRQFNLPGREFDSNNTPNDWAALSAAYCLDNVTRNHRKPEVEEFIDSLIKAAAIIVGALEHVDIMIKKGHFLPCSSLDQNDS